MFISNINYAYFLCPQINTTITIIAIIFLQIPHSLAINILSTMSLQGFTSNVTSFTLAVVIIRVLYVANSAIHCVTYYLLSRRFRAQFWKTFCGKACQRKAFYCCHRGGQRGSSLVIDNNSRLNKWTYRVLSSCLGKDGVMRKSQSPGSGSSESKPSTSVALSHTTSTSLCRSRSPIVLPA